MFFHCFQYILSATKVTEHFLNRATGGRCGQSLTGREQKVVYTQTNFYFLISFSNIGSAFGLGQDTQRLNSIEY